VSARELHTHPLFTIGHSNLEPSEFLEVLEQCKVSILADVRSRPRSFRFPQFNQDVLTEALSTAAIQYLFLGEELGGRPEDPKAYRADGLVDYRARRRSRGFQMGIERILSALEDRSVALMCAEEEPLTCHRFLMICPEFVAAGLQPQHIRRSATIETQVQAEDRLLALHNFSDVATNSLFSSDRASALEDAYLLQAEHCAFRADPNTVDSW
jgi:uncharacterized protein (DUF488 family)